MSIPSSIGPSPLRQTLNKACARTSAAALLLLLMSTTPLAADRTPAPSLQLDAAVAEASHRFGLPAAWIRAVIAVESAGAPHVVSPTGAMGLMQIMPATWRDLRRRHDLGADPFDPRDNILAGAAYLRELLDRYGAPGFLAAYNAGPGRYEDAMVGDAALPSETRHYLAKLTPIVMGSPSTAPAPVDPWRASLFAAGISSAKVVVPTPEPAPADRPASLSAFASSGLFPGTPRLEARR